MASSNDFSAVPASATDEHDLAQVRLPPYLVDWNVVRSSHSKVLLHSCDKGNPICPPSLKLCPLLNAPGTLHSSGDANAAVPARLPHATTPASELAWALGEKTAQALESNLTSLEKKIDDLLASFEESERAKVDEANSKQDKGVVGSDGNEEKA
ncbi:hypothetical protein BKA64DRAFT_739828 [Cadophora sp. MPI-SDFR-AT-0126]|nr:hypothetical protein BKA64DRAFT_739828 [Leotiomycetes sp. MPI-SDFR-AT-0126]